MAGPRPTALSGHLETGVAPQADALVFAAPGGGPLRYTNLRRRVWEPATRAVGLPGITPYLLRHTWATLLIAAGANVKDVQEHLGHADAAMTPNVYAG